MTRLDLLFSLYGSWFLDSKNIWVTFGPSVLDPGNIVNIMICILEAVRIGATTYLKMPAEGLASKWQCNVVVVILRRVCWLFLEDESYIFSRMNLYIYIYIIYTVATIHNKICKVMTCSCYSVFYNTNGSCLGFRGHCELQKSRWCAISRVSLHLFWMISLKLHLPGAEKYSNAKHDLSR